MVRVGTIKKPAKKVKSNMITKNLMVGNIDLAFNLLNEYVWGAVRTQVNESRNYGGQCPPYIDTYPAPPSKPLGRMNRTSKSTMKAMTSL